MRATYEILEITMFFVADLRRVVRRTLLTGACAAALAASGAMGQALQTAPNALLTIDQNRNTVVERIVGEWGEVMAKSGAGLSPEQLRVLLMGLRADHLLAANLAGDLDGLRNVLANALTSTADVKASLLHAKALGDPAADLVYTPVVPCRIIDTRVVGGPFAAGGQTRNYHAFLTSGTFATQGGAASNCAIPANPAAAALNITTLGGGGFLTAWRFNTSMPQASTLIPAATVANGAIVPLCQPNCAAEFSVFTFGANLVIDIVGYFKAPGAPIGTVSSVATGTGLTGGPITTTGTIGIAAGGVGATQLAPNAVTTAKIADGNVTPAKISGAGCLAGQGLVYNGTTWSCGSMLASLAGVPCDTGNLDKPDGRTRVTVAADTGAMTFDCVSATTNPVLTVSTGAGPRSCQLTFCAGYTHYTVLEVDAVGTPVANGFMCGGLTGTSTAIVCSTQRFGPAAAVRLGIIAVAGYVPSWTGCDSVNAGICTFTMTGARTVAVAFVAAS